MSNVYEIHDVWVRWDYSRDTDGLFVAEFHEWRKSDEVTLLEIAPLVLMDSDSLRVIEENNGEFPTQIIEKAKEIVSLTRMENYDMDTDFYNLGLTDGKRVVLVQLDTEDYTVECFGRTVINKESKILNMVRGANIPEYNLRKEVEGADDEKSVFHLTDAHMIGLTRTERELKRLLVHNLASLFKTADKGLVKYFYTGLFQGTYGSKELEDKTEEQIMNEIIDFIKTGWSDRHEQFGTETINHVDEYVGRWEHILSKKRALDRVVE